MSFYRVYEIDNLYVGELNIQQSITSTYPSAGTILYTNGTGGTFWSTGGSGSGSGNADLVSKWISTYLIQAPASIVFGSPVSKSSQIFIPWTYPGQYNVGFQSNYVQTILALNATLSTNVIGLNPTTLINSLSSGGYVNYNNNTPYITGIVLSRTAGASGVQSVNFPQDGLNRYAYVFYNTALSGLTSSGGSLTGWYQNYNIGSNPSTVVFGPFEGGGPPTAPQRLFSTNVTSNSLYFYFSTPTYVDDTDPASVATISQYNLSWTSEPIAGRRYGTPVYDSQTATVTSPFTFVTAQDGLTGQVIRYLAGPSAITLYPDSTYQFNISARNSLGYTGPLASTMGINTLNLVQDSFFTSITFPSRYYATGGYTYNRVRSGVTGVTTLVNSATDWTSSAFINPIQTTAARGTQGIGTAYLSTLFTFPSTILGPGQKYNGFPATTPVSVTQNALTITPTNVYDK